MAVSCDSKSCWGWCLRREEIMRLPMMLNGTRSEAGQIPGTLDEVARGGQNPIFWVLGFTPLRQWISPRTGAWTFLQEENPSSPRSGRSHRSDVWSRNGSDSEFSARAFWAIICWVSIPHLSAALPHVVENAWGRCPWREEIMGPPNV